MAFPNLVNAAIFDAFRQSTYNAPMSIRFLSVAIPIAVLFFTPQTWTSSAIAQTPGEIQVLPGPGAAPPPKKLPYHKTIKKLPATAGERREILSNLYAHLATAPDEHTAAEIASTIESLWFHSGSDTISVLLNRASTAMLRKDLDLAGELLDAVVDLAPDFAEGWNRRAIVRYMQNDYASALGDLRGAIALEPNHFKALDGLGRVLSAVGQKRGALEAFRLLKNVHPFWKNADKTIKDLEEEVEGQGI